MKQVPSTQYNAVQLSYFILMCNSARVWTIGYPLTNQEKKNLKAMFATLVGINKLSYKKLIVRVQCCAISPNFRGEFKVCGIKMCDFLHKDYYYNTLPQLDPDNTNTN